MGNPSAKPVKADKPASADKQDDSPKAPATKATVSAEIALPEWSAEEQEQQIARYHDILLTSSSILAGFSLTGLLGLPEVGPKGIDVIREVLLLPKDFPAFQIVYMAVLCATICFLGVLVGIVSFRLQSYRPSLPFLRFSFRSSVLVFGVGIGALFTATITIGIPSIVGFYVGIGSAVVTVLMMFYRAFFLQQRPGKSPVKQDIADAE